MLWDLTVNGTEKREKNVPERELQMRLHFLPLQIILETKESEKRS